MNCGLKNYPPKLYHFKSRSGVKQNISFTPVNYVSHCFTNHLFLECPCPLLKWLLVPYALALKKKLKMRPLPGINVEIFLCKIVQLVERDFVQKESRNKKWPYIS